MNMLLNVFGIDPGTRNFAMCSGDGKIQYTSSIASYKNIYDFIRNTCMDIKGFISVRKQKPGG